MQSNTHLYKWLIERDITPTVIEQFGLSVYEHPTAGTTIRIPIDPVRGHAKYRRDPLDPRKPKYLYDAGGKVTLYGSPYLQSSDMTTVVITEGELDTLVLWSQNIPAVSSTGGAMSWQAEWSEALSNHDVYICLDNDDTGAKGTVKILKTLPNAKIILIPELPDVKDISDFVSRGGDFRSLLASALPNDPQVIEEDQQRRKGQFLSTRFHKIYLDAHRQELHKQTYSTPNYQGDDRVLRAKSVPMTNFIEFNRSKKACCPWHNERTPSLHYFPKTNSAYCFGQCGRAYDVIDAYRLQNPNATFKEAVDALNNML